MDTQELEVIARQDRRSFIAVVGGRTVATATQDEQETAAKLVKRWNAHPELVAALEAIRNWSNSRDGSAETDEAALTEINGIAARALNNQQ